LRLIPSFVNPFLREITIFFQQIFIRCLLYAKHCAGKVAKRPFRFYYLKVVEKTLFNKIRDKGKIVSAGY
jgi:hypothetical protein